jgi:hypothetical protein
MWWCSGRDLNPGLRIEGPQCWAGLQTVAMRFRFDASTGALSVPARSGASPSVPQISLSIIEVMNSLLRSSVYSSLSVDYMHI